jgi:hypothetical protein
MTVSDPLDRAVDAELAAWAPASAPPFSEVQARRRRSDRTRAAAVAVGLVIGGIGAVAVVPSLLPIGDRLESRGTATDAGDAEEAPGSRGPELGRVPTPADLLAALPSGPGRGAPPPPGRFVDVLARHVDGGITVGTYGWLSGDLFCKATFVSEPSYGQVGVEPALCGLRAQDFDRLAVGRALGLRPGGVLKQVVWGTAPRGTERVRLSSPGQQPVEVEAFSAGPDWPPALFFTATWPAKTPLTVTALADDGTVLTTASG